VSCSLTTQIMIISHCLTNWKALTTTLPLFTHVRPSLYVKSAWPITRTAQRHRTPCCLGGLDPRDSRNLWVSLSLPWKSRPCSVPELWGARSDLDVGVERGDWYCLFRGAASSQRERCRHQTSSSPMSEREE
jgi:hypothetical protein